MCDFLGAFHKTLAVPAVLNRLVFHSLVIDARLSSIDM
jgi:hypothetical protein